MQSWGWTSWIGYKGQEPHQSQIPARYLVDVNLEARNVSKHFGSHQDEELSKVENYPKINKL